MGCSGSFPGPDSAASCYLVQAADAAGRTWRVLLDLGSGALGPLQRLVDLDQLDAVLVTHLHPDHYLDLCGLYVARQYNPEAGPNPRRLPVFGPPGTAERLAAAYGPDKHGPAQSFDIRVWTDGAQVRIGPLAVTARLVEHPVTAFGLRVEHEGRVLAYSGDTDACPALVELAAGAQLLLAEAAFLERRDTDRGIHMTGQRAGEVARQAGAHRLVLTHLPIWTDPQAVLAEAKGAFPGPVELAAPYDEHAV